VDLGEVVVFGEFADVRVVGVDVGEFLLKVGNGFFILFDSIIISMISIEVLLLLDGLL